MPTWLLPHVSSFFFEFIISKLSTTPDWEASQQKPTKLTIQVSWGGCCSVYIHVKVKRDMHLPASQFWGQLGEEVGGCPGAGMWQRASVMVRQGRWSRWGWVYWGPTVPQLSPMKGAADCWATGQAASVWRGRGGGSSGPRNAECWRRCCRHAVTQGAARMKWMALS